MGIVFWVLVVFGGFLGCEMVLFALKFTPSKLKKSSKLHKYIHLQHNLYEILSNYLAVHHVIPLTSLTLYLLNACFSLKCLFSDETISATKLVKLDIILSILLIIGLFHHFFRILILVQRHNWLGLYMELDKVREEYGSRHGQIMGVAFGKGHDMEMNFRRLSQGSYKMLKLHELEKTVDTKEERFNELGKFLGR